MNDNIRGLIERIEAADESEILERARLCPICKHGTTHLVAPEVWHCDRIECNNEFFIDGEPGGRLLNVRDKAVASPFKRPPSLFERIRDRLKAMETPNG